MKLFVIGVLNGVSLLIHAQNLFFLCSESLNIDRLKKVSAYYKEPSYDDSVLNAEYYFERGRLVCQIDYSSNEVVSKTEYDYRSRGDLLKVRSTGLKNECRYYLHGQIVGFVNEKGDSSSFYYEKGRLCEIISCAKKNNLFTIDTIVVLYDFYGREVTRIRGSDTLSLYKYTDGAVRGDEILTDYRPTGLKSLIVSKNGRIFAELQFDDKGEVNSITSHAYDEFGNRSILSQILIVNGIYTSNIWSYEYLWNSDCLKKETYFGGNSSIEYFYNAHYMLKKEVMREQGKVIYETIYNYEFY